jgi:glucoamylase
VATDGTNSDAILTSSGFRKTSSGFLATSDGWTDLATDHRMDWTYTAGQPGNVVQTGQTGLTGLAGGQHLWPLDSALRPPTQSRLQGHP